MTFATDMTTIRCVSEAGYIVNVTKSYSADDIFIAVMGMTGAGKTRFVANCTGESVIDHSGLESCMNIYQPH